MTIIQSWTASLAVILVLYLVGRHMQQSAAKKRKQKSAIPVTLELHNIRGGSLGASSSQYASPGQSRPTYQA